MDNQDQLHPKEAARKLWQLDYSTVKEVGETAMKKMQDAKESVELSEAYGAGISLMSFNPYTEDEETSEVHRVLATNTHGDLRASVAASFMVQLAHDNPDLFFVALQEMNANLPEDIAAEVITPGQLDQFVDDSTDE